jgi:hypothetical protein
MKGYDCETLLEIAGCGRSRQCKLVKKMHNPEATSRIEPLTGIRMMKQRSFGHSGQSAFIAGRVKAFFPIQLNH